MQLKSSYFVYKNRDCLTLVVRQSHLLSLAFKCLNPYTCLEYIGIQRIIFIFCKQHRFYKIAYFSFKFPQKRRVFKIIIFKTVNDYCYVNIAAWRISPFTERTVKIKSLYRQSFRNGCFITFGQFYSLLFIHSLNSSVCFNNSLQRSSCRLLSNRSLYEG